MAKQKYNRIELKRKYLESDILELSERIKHEIGQDNGTIRAATAGWREMKDRHIEERERKALEASEKAKIKALMIPKSKYYEMKKELIEGMMDAITIEMKKIKAWQGSVIALRELLRMVKAELLEPYNITQTTNKIENEELPLSEADQALLASLLGADEEDEEADW